MFTKVCLILPTLFALTFGAAVDVLKHGDVNTKQYNYFAHLQHISQSGEIEELGGGTVLDEKWILTAAHILDNINETNLEVIIENYAIINYTAEVDTKIVKVYKIHKHPKWISSLRGNPLPAQYDIALLELLEPIVFDSGFKKVQLQRNRDEIPDHQEPFSLAENIGFIQFPIEASAPDDLQKFYKNNDTCKNYQIDDGVKRKKNFKVCSFFCKGNTIGTSVLERKFMKKGNYIKDTILGVLTLEMLPCNEGPLKIYTEVTPYVDEFILLKVGFSNFEPEYDPELEHIDT